MGPSICSLPVSRQCFLFQEGNGHMLIAPSFQGRLRLLSGTSQMIMKPLEKATEFLPWEKGPTAQKHFVVILGGATQLHLGGKPVFAFEQPSLQLGSHLGMGVFFQFCSMMSRVSSNKYTRHPSWGHLYLKLPNYFCGLRQWMNWWG